MRKKGCVKDKDSPIIKTVDIRFVTPLLKITNEPYLLWLKRIDAELDYFEKIFDWVNSVNT